MIYEAKVTLTGSSTESQNIGVSFPYLNQIITNNGSVEPTASVAGYPSSAAGAGFDGTGFGTDPASINVILSFDGSQGTRDILVNYGTGSGPTTLVSLTFGGGLVVDGSTVFGCTDSTATNYNPAATIDDGSCVYKPPPGPGPMPCPG